MDFRAIVDEVLAGYFRAYPVQATEIGHHAYDGEWPDLTDAGRASRLAWITAASAQVEAVSPDALSRDDAIDRRILLENLAAIRFGEATLDEGSWNPMTYVYLFGTGLFGLLAREFAPLPDRMRSASARLAALPAALDQARATLDAGGARPISTFHNQKAAERMSGLIDLVDTAVQEASALDDGALRADVEAAAGPARDARKRLRRLAPRRAAAARHGDFRLGAELYAQKFRHALKTDLTPDQLEARAASALRRGPGPDATRWPASCGQPGWATSRCPRTTTGRSAACWTPSPPTTRGPRSCSTGAAPRTSGSRRSSPSATSSAWRMSRCRSSGPRSSCAPSAAPC